MNRIGFNLGSAIATGTSGYAGRQPAMASLIIRRACAWSARWSVPLDIVGTAGHPPWQVHTYSTRRWLLRRSAASKANAIAAGSGSTASTPSTTAPASPSIG